MRKILTTNLLLFAFLYSGFAQIQLIRDPSSTWLSYMNVFELPANGNAFVFQNPWSIPDLKTTIDVSPAQHYNLISIRMIQPMVFGLIRYLFGAKNSVRHQLLLNQDAAFNGNDLTFSGMLFQIRLIRPFTM